MENNDNTLREMQEQMQQLRDKLDNQKIVNERILKKSCSQTASRLRFKANLPILFGVAAMLLVPSLRSFGVSMGRRILSLILKYRSSSNRNGNFFSMNALTFFNILFSLPFRL